MKNIISALLLAAAVPAALAQVEVGDAWIRATVPSAKSSGVFMRLKSKQDAQLVAVRAEVAGVAEIHQMQMEGQLMKMHAVPSLDLPAGRMVDLASGGYHVMLMDLKRQLKQGETVPVTLVIRKKGKQTDTVTVDVPVKPLTYTPPKGQ
ncbi:copper chaperone PCu(A)C [Duganella sp. BJB488]|uniref:copper chaperone PCu(A)C n=1 Tax=unclassified Duganella TaxID=2636909 RepID=UPI000E34E881|nr:MULTISPECIES: copper chaperone PCu(A)C [unclassified Duganella]RFP15158.1 copper chaperone PCu(A)C [Duganella sp. BJB489]RFP19713.1 copper chaperone PCu(A)C [Duganella sp. BJB488]RFP38101.1 copper chaperone PCu(A)C [Duganella sp. BJB480]